MPDSGFNQATRGEEKILMRSSGYRTTKRPSGSFELRKVTNHLSGADKIVAKATNLHTGESCNGSAIS